MKKLNFKLGGIGEMLTKEQMKKVVGGDYAGGCGSNECTTDADCSAIYVKWTKCTTSKCTPGSTATIRVCTS